MMEIFDSRADAKSLHCQCILAGAHVMQLHSNTMSAVVIIIATPSFPHSSLLRSTFLPCQTPPSHALVYICFLCPRLAPLVLHQTATALISPSGKPAMGDLLPMEHMRDMMMLMALGGDVTYGWKENFCLCAITASSFWSRMLL